MMKLVLVCFLVTFFVLDGHASLSCSSLLGKSLNIPLLMVEAKTAFRAGDHDTAHRTLDKILELHPSDFRALGLKSRLMTAENNHLDALALQLKVIELERGYREASYLALAHKYNNLDNLDELGKTLDIILESNPNHVAALGMRIKVHLTKNELNEARDLLAQKLELDSNDKHSLGLSAELFYKKKDYDRALKFVDHLIFVSKPRKFQKGLPSSYVIGLAIRSKINAARAETADAAINDIEVIEKIFNKFSPWLQKIKAEAYFRRGAGTQGKFDVKDLQESLRTLNLIIQNSVKPDLSVIAAAVRVQEQLPDSRGAYLNLWRNVLGSHEFNTMVKMSKNLDWDAVPDPKEDSTPSDMRNNFWSSLYTAPVNNFTSKSTFSREPN